MFSENCDKPYITVDGKFLIDVTCDVFKLCNKHIF